MSTRPDALEELFRRYLPNSPHFEKSDKFGLKDRQRRNYEKLGEMILSREIQQNEIKSRKKESREKQQREKQSREIDTVVISDEEDLESAKSSSGSSGEIGEIEICEVGSLSPEPSPRSIKLVLPKFFRCYVCDQRFERKQDHISHHLKNHLTDAEDQIYMAGAVEIRFI